MYQTVATCSNDAYEVSLSVTIPNDVTIRPLHVIRVGRKHPVDGKVEYIKPMSYSDNALTKRHSDAVFYKRYERAQYWFDATLPNRTEQNRMDLKNAFGKVWFMQTGRSMQPQQPK